MGFFDTPETKGLQILFKDNRHVKFRTIPIRHTCLCEVDQTNNKRVLRGWKDYFRNHYSFNGYKNLASGEATLSYERDVVLNLNNVIPKEQLPKEGGDLTQYNDIARSRFKQIASRPQSSTVADKITLILMGTFGLSAIALIYIFIRASVA